MFSAKAITPGTTRTSDLVWWWRQRVQRPRARHLVPAERRACSARATTDADIGADPVIQRGDVLHCDVGITVARLNTDTQHMAYVLREGETDAPAGLQAGARQRQRAAGHRRRGAEARAHRQRDPRRVARADEGARASTARCTRIPIGLHGHGAGPLIGLWDYQDGVPGRGDAKVIPSMWYSIELQATTPVPEWDGQPVRMAQEEDVIIDADGKVRWALKRQDALFLVTLIRPRRQR